jgi:hypothetical protein
VAWVVVVIIARVLKGKNKALVSALEREQKNEPGGLLAYAVM